MRCDLCGKFCKKKDLNLVAGDSNDVGDYEEWLECVKCCAPVDVGEGK